MFINIETLRFPIGTFEKPAVINAAILEQWIQDIANFPTQVEAILQPLSSEQLNWKYRPEGWTIKQVVHHCADSHMNSLIRFKLTLTEDAPTIRPYWENRWAELPDSLEEDMEDVLLLLRGLHGKWVKLLRTLTPEQLSLEFIHPEYGKRYTLDENIGVYAWHCRHHFAHIEQALRYKGQFNAVDDKSIVR